MIHAHSPVVSQSSGNLIADRRYAWAEGSAAEGDHAAAADLFTQALEIVPHWAPAWLALGEALQKSGDVDGARAAFAQAAALDPAGVLGAELRLAALGGAASPSLAPQAYVRGLFDQYANRFDAHLTGALHYRAPEILRELVARANAARGRREHFSLMLDLGCGTGLAGKSFAACVHRIEGVDLSTAMLALAEKTGCYERLVVGDLVDFLIAAKPGAADLVIAADVFVYMGDLGPAFEACARAMARDGLFAFTTQFLSVGDWSIGADLRYAHSADYLRRMAESYGFEVRTLEAISTRRDAGVDTPGLAAVLMK